MNLVYDGMITTDVKLIVWEVCVDDCKEAFECELFNYFGEEEYNADWSGFPGLSIIIMIKNCQSKGKYESLSIEF